MVAQIITRHTDTVVSNANPVWLNGHIDPGVELLPQMPAQQYGVKRVLNILAQKGKRRRIDLRREQLDHLADLDREGNFF